MLVYMHTGFKDTAVRGTNFIHPYLYMVFI